MEFLINVNLPNVIKVNANSKEEAIEKLKASMDFRQASLAKFEFIDEIKSQKGEN